MLSSMLYKTTASIGFTLEHSNNCVYRSCETVNLPLAWHPKAVAMTKMVVNRSKKETPCQKSGIILGFCVLPSNIACIAMAEQMKTNKTANRIDIAEACRNESKMAKTAKELVISSLQRYQLENIIFLNLLKTRVVINKLTKHFPEEGNHNFPLEVSL
jgi:hypothetical protein